MRAATADHHDRVDRLFSKPDLADRDGYGRFLLAQAAAHIPVEYALTRAGAASVLPDWPARRRGGLLHADLAALGLAPPVVDEAVAFEGDAAVLGAIYVLEGSRLGGNLLKRSVASHLPASFLGGGDSGAWRRLLAVLDERLGEEAERQIAIKAASRVFVLFEQGGQLYLKA